MKICGNKQSHELLVKIYSFVYIYSNLALSIKVKMHEVFSEDNSRTQTEIHSCTLKDRTYVCLHAEMYVCM